MVGRLELILGPMFSSKTKELKSRIERAKALDVNVLVVNHSSDTRYGRDCIATHSAEHHFAHSFDRLDEIFRMDLAEYDMVAIDEGSLFPDLNEVVRKLIAEPYNKYVVVASLSGDSNKELFGTVHLLICKAEDITHKKALCQLCGKEKFADAPFTKWVGDHAKTTQVNIGAKGKYIAVCSNHY